LTDDIVKNNSKTCLILHGVGKRQAGHRDQRLQLRPN